ncbi:hypothetical protein ACFWWU_36475 [Streptomyces sp. NPDC058650]|uniref:hypothetical protein n=1 Tax=Streptomyces sp. NPDC058650 TaxID=3346575 RepID=UPI00365CB5E7
MPGLHISYAACRAAAAERRRVEAQRAARKDERRRAEVARARAAKGWMPADFPLAA